MHSVYYQASNVLMTTVDSALDALAKFWFSTHSGRKWHANTWYYKAQKNNNFIYKNRPLPPSHKPLNSVTTEECYVCACGWGWEFYRTEKNTTLCKPSVFFHPPIQSEFSFIWCHRMQHCMCPLFGSEVGGCQLVHLFCICIAFWKKSNPS